MKKLFGLVKQKMPDEMEKHIRLKAIECSWLYTAAALFTWTMYESFRAKQDGGSVNLIPCFLLVSLVWVQIIASFVIRTRMSKNGDEESTPKSNKFLIVILLAAMFIALSVTITFSVLGTQ